MKEKCLNHPEKEALSYCHSCGRFFCADCLTEGVEYSYCKDEKCQKARKTELAEKHKVIPIRSTQSPPGIIVCQSCGIEAPTKYVEFYENMGALVMRFHKSIKAYLCKKCIKQHFWSFTGITSVLGWWSPTSFFVTPFILLNNIIRYVGTLGLEAPALGAIRPVLTKAAVTKIQPYFGEIVKRLGASEPLEQVAQSIAPQAGVSTAQVMLYIAALAKAAAEHQKAVSS